jgi:uncharacterized protein (TIGR00290 family)
VASPRAAVSWSGGKDSYLALHRSIQSYDIAALITMFDEAGIRSRSHGLRPEILRAQADRLGIPLVTGSGTWDTYEAGFRHALRDARRLGITHVIFGDILYESNREFPERVCAAEGLVPVEPLWGEPTTDLYRAFIATGADARIVTTRAGVLDESWLGQQLTLELLDALTNAGADACGEHGEYHTVVLDAPRFSSPIQATPGERVQRGGCWALDLRLEEATSPGMTVHAAGV